MTAPAAWRVAATGMRLRLALAVCGAWLAGCKSAPGPGASPAGPSIGVTLLTVQHQFYQELKAGLEEAAARRGYRLLVSSAEFDSARQSNQIDEFIVQKVAALVVSPCDSRSVGASIAAANRAGIPVFTADIASTSPVGRVVAHIASDNVRGGREAARLMKAALNGTGAVAILSHPEVASVSDRVRGFREELAQSPGLKIVAELSADGKRDKAVRVMEDLLQSHPDLRGVFGINDDSALGALAAIESAGKLEQIRIVGYDATPEAREKIRAGKLFGDVVQNPREIGRLTIEAIAEHLAGRAPAALVPVAVSSVTRDRAP
ncbi:MAG: substrate-binding domain-containing protein [Phycisphaerae bacterium]